MSGSNLEPTWLQFHWRPPRGGHRRPPTFGSRRSGEGFLHSGHSWLSWRFWHCVCSTLNCSTPNCSTPNCSTSNCFVTQMCSGCIHDVQYLEKSSPDPPKSSPGASKIEPGALQDAIFKDLKKRHLIGLLAKNIRFWAFKFESPKTIILDSMLQGVWSPWGHPGTTWASQNLPKSSPGASKIEPGALQDAIFKRPLT